MWEHLRRLEAADEIVELHRGSKVAEGIVHVRSNPFFSILNPDTMKPVSEVYMGVVEAIEYYADGHVIIRIEGAMCWRCKHWGGFPESFRAECKNKEHKKHSSAGSLRVGRELFTDRGFSCKLWKEYKS